VPYALLTPRHDCATSLFSSPLLAMLSVSPNRDYSDIQGDGIDILYTAVTMLFQTFFFGKLH